MSDYLECSNSNGLLLHNIKLPETPLRVIIRDYMDDIIVLFNGTSFEPGEVSYIKDLPTSSFDKVIGVYTNDLKLKHLFYIPTDVIDIKENILYIKLAEDLVASVDLTNITLDYTIINAYVIPSITNNGTKIFAYGEVIYSHTFKKLLVYQNKALLCLDTNAEGKDVIYYIDLRDISKKRPYIYSVETEAKIYDFQIDDKLVLVLFKSVDMNNHTVISILDENLREAAERIDLSENGMDTRNISISKEFEYDIYRSYILFIDSVSNTLKKCLYNGLFVDTDNKQYLFNNAIRDMNGQEYQNKLYSLEANESLFAVKVKLTHKVSTKNIIKTIYIPYSKYLFGTQFISVNLNNTTGAFDVYFNGKLIKSLTYDTHVYELDILVGPQFSLGQTTYFNNVPLNTYAKLNSGYIAYNTKFDNVRVFGKAINYTDVNLYVKKKYGIDDMTMNVPINKNNMFDVVDRFFKFKGQNHKTTKFNIVIQTDTTISDETKNTVETSIKNQLVDLIPNQTDLNNIIWQ